MTRKLPLAALALSTLCLISTGCQTVDKARDGVSDLAAALHVRVSVVPPELCIGLRVPDDARVATEANYTINDLIPVEVTK